MENRNFIGYEYKEIVADTERASLLLDGYENFGWEQDDNLAGSGGIGHSSLPGKVVLRLKRNRKIINKVELTRLQRNFEACVREIDELEKSKRTAATIYSLLVGIIGTAFMAGSVFAIVAPQPQVLLCIILAVPAFIGWLLPYFIYRRSVRKQTEKIAPLIEAKYDEIYELCEKGNRLLH